MVNNTIVNIYFWIFIWNCKIIIADNDRHMVNYVKSEYDWWHVGQLGDREVYAYKRY